jgi:hypothetical protein
VTPASAQTLSSLTAANSLCLVLLQLPSGERLALSMTLGVRLDKGSQQGRWPDGPPKAKPGPVPGSRQDSPMSPPPSATYKRLREYTAKQMRMRPIDQPLMLLELLGRRSPAPAQDVARRILGSRWWARCSPATASPPTAAAPTA